MRIAIVVQRYGTEVIGGAETYARVLAEKLTQMLGWDVTVYTSCAKSYQTWANEYPLLLETINGVSVKRFPTIFKRNRFLFKFISKFVSTVFSLMGSRSFLKSALNALEKFWFVAQGPYCPSLVTALEEHEQEYEQIIFISYLYYPTVFGLPQVASKSILVPTAHDEFPFHFPMVGKLFTAARAICVNTEPERDLISKTWPAAASKVFTLGIGFEEFDAVLQKKSVPDKPYLLYLGRISHGKNIPQMVSWFLDFVNKNPNCEVELYLAGKVEAGVTLPQHPALRLLGFVAEAEKKILIRNSLGVVNPSPLESLSMLVLEGIALHVPVLVNGNCDVLNYYSEHTKTVFSFRNLSEFQNVLRMVTTTNWQSESSVQDLNDSFEWGKERYSWHSVLGRLKSAL